MPALKTILIKGKAAVPKRVKERIKDLLALRRTLPRKLKQKVKKKVARVLPRPVKDRLKQLRSLLNPKFPAYTPQDFVRIRPIQPKRTSRTAGRNAAAVTRDPRAALNLFAAMQPQMPQAGAGRSIAVIGSDALAEKLSSYGAVFRLHPTLATAEMAKMRPDTLIIEEDCFNQGSWTGALDAGGVGLLRDIIEVRKLARAAAAKIYLVAATGVAGVAAEQVRRGAFMIDGDFARDFASDDPPDSLLRALVAHRAERQEARA